MLESLHEKYVEKGMELGWEKGRQEGRQEGREEQNRENARNLLLLGVPIETITKATGLSEEEVKKLQ